MVGGGGEREQHRFLAVSFIERQHPRLRNDDSRGRAAEQPRALRRSNARRVRKPGRRAEASPWVGGSHPAYGLVAGNQRIPMPGKVGIVPL